MTQDDDAAAHERTAGEPSLAIDDAHFKLTWRQVDRDDRVLESFVKNGIDGVFYNLWTQKRANETGNSHQMNQTTRNLSYLGFTFAVGRSIWK